MSSNKNTIKVAIAIIYNSPLQKLTDEGILQCDAAAKLKSARRPYEDINRALLQQITTKIWFRKQSNKILITQRGLEREHPGKWEFPGGKIKDKENPTTALRREIKEELGLIINKSRLFALIDYTYPRKNVQLLVYEVIDYQGTPKCLENQLDLKWVSAEDLSNYDFLEANYKIIKMIIS
jgi:8-oxo-dGTP diphosphatase